MALKKRPQMERLKYPLTPRQVEALDNMLEQLFRASKRTSSVSLSEGTLAGRGSASGDGPPEEITLGSNLSIVGTELQIDASGLVSALVTAGRWEVLTDGAPYATELVFAGGEAIYVFNPTP